MSDLDDIQHPHVAERVADDLYSSESEDIIMKTTPVMSQDTITRSDLQEIIDGWEEKFNKLAEGVRAIEEGTHDVHAHVDMVMRENRARKNGQLATNKQLKLIQEALVRFMEMCDPAHPTPVLTFAQQCAPKMSTPITPSGAPTRYRSKFSFTSPVNQTAPVEPTRGNGGRDLSHRPTHEDGNGNGSNTQQPTMNTSSGLNNITTRYSSSPKVPIFDGIPPLAHTVRGHRTPTMLDVGRESGTPGSFSDRSGSQYVNRNDHGPTGRLCIPSRTLIAQI